MDGFDIETKDSIQTLNKCLSRKCQADPDVVVQISKTQLVNVFVLVLCPVLPPFPKPLYQCGKRRVRTFPETSNRVVGGRDATLAEFPFQVPSEQDPFQSALIRSTRQPDERLPEIQLCGSARLLM